MIETLEDIVEQLANQLGIYGAHGDRPRDCKPPRDCCRCCFVADLKARIEAAVEVERLLSR